jgi:monoamine oxidase
MVREVATKTAGSTPAPSIEHDRADVYDVIVIGGGWSGLLAAKYCLVEGLKTVVLESRDTIGGVWAYTDDQRIGGVMKTKSKTQLGGATAGGGLVQQEA